jgi:hypothetical protein
MTVTEDISKRGATGTADPQALFEEARRRRRRRYRLSALVAMVALCLGVALALSFGGVSPKSQKPHVRATPIRRTVSPPTSAGVAPSQPGPLALGPNGDLYIADDARNEILERLPDGRFQVVAGNGTAGFSGDGGPAQKAQLDRPEGIAVGSDGTVYVADSGNSRVRAVSPSGTISTIAGNGNAAAGAGDTPVVGPSATETAIGAPSAVTLGAGGSLYIATANAVLELSTVGTLSTVAGPQNFLGVDQRYPDTPECDPDGLAFDGSGDLFMTCSNTNDLLEETAGGSFVYRGILRPHDASAALASAPDGSVIGLWQSAMYRFTATQQRAVTSFDTVPGVGDFWPQGVAVAPDGTIYLDQDGISGIGPPAIVAYAPSGVARTLWSQASAAPGPEAAAR